MVAPIYACNSHDYYADCNADAKSVFQGWQAVAKGHLFVWMYNKIFKYYFNPFSTTSRLLWTIITFSKISAPCLSIIRETKRRLRVRMQELMCYVEAKLMWDTSLSFDALADDFIEHYYKEAAPWYREYYDLVRMSYSKWEAQGLHCYNSSSRAEEIYDEKYWTQNLLDRFEMLFGQMPRCDRRGV